MTGKRGKSGGKRDGAGRPTLTEQFFEQVRITRFESETEEQENANVAQCIALQKRIAARLAKIRAELEELERAEVSREWRGVAAEAKRAAKK